MVPFGNIKYDEGERFDLRNPFSDTGYIDPDEMSAWDSFKRFGRKVFDWDGQGKDMKEDAKKVVMIPENPWKKGNQ
jgi:hypothetical protein